MVLCNPAEEKNQFQKRAVKHVKKAENLLWTQIDLS